jgi:hypothetical protein
VVEVTIRHPGVIDIAHAAVDSTGMGASKNGVLSEGGKILVDLRKSNAMTKRPGGAHALRIMRT